MDRADLEQWKAREVARLLSLVETERRYYQEIVASIPVGLLVLASDLSIISSNRAIRRIFELRGGDALRGRLDALLPGWVLDRATEVLKTGVSQTNLRVEAESTASKKVLRIAILAIRNWDDDPAQEVVLSIEDLTGVGATGEQLFLVPDAKPAAEPPPPEAPEPLHEEPPAEPEPAKAGIPTTDLIVNLDVILWTFDIPTNTFVFVSPHAEQVLGFPVSRWTSNETFWTDRIHPEDRDWVTQSYINALKQRGTHSCEFRAETADGRTVWLRESSRLLHDSQGEPNYLVGLTMDVSERRLLEDQLVQSERVEAVAKLASRLAHDLNNMLMILTGYGEELLSETPTQSVLRADIQEILHATERMTGLTTQLLSFARRPPVAGVSDVQLETVLEAMGIEPQTAARPTIVKADAGQLEQVIKAVIDKARLAGGNITVNVSHVQIAEDIRRPAAPLRPGSFGVISISSAGHALEDDLRTSLFESALAEKDAAEDSTAVSRAYGIVRQWGGDIAVSSGAAEGMAFHIYLPLVEQTVTEQPEPAPEEPVIPVVEPEKPHVETILVVEDEAGIRALVRKILHRQGYEIMEAASGEEALALSSGHAGVIDLLITDMIMPNMGGRELAEKLTAQRKDLKVLYVSGYTDDAGIYAGDFPPGTAFLQKPFTLGSLLEKVKEVLSAR
jgi:PAS domain S-box-containing protein